MKKVRVCGFLILVSLIFAIQIAPAQTTAFLYQGKLIDNGAPANGNYLIQFKLFDAIAGGSQVGATLTDIAVAASAGVFSARLDFGASPFTGPNRFIEVAVRRNATESYVTLSPREQITSSPFSIRTLSAVQADTALDSQRLGGVLASEYLTNATNAFVRNQTTQQTANFNVDGTGTVGNLTTNNGVAIAGSSPPAASAGQGKIYFDSSTNKMRVSENGGAYVDLVGAAGVSGSGTVNSIPLWSAGTTLGSSLITQTGTTINMPSTAAFAASGSGHTTQIGTPNGETGITFSGAGARSDIRFNGTLKIVNGPGGVQSSANGIAISTAGNVGVGTDPFLTGKLQVLGGAGQPGVYAETNNRGVWGRTTGSSFGVYGESTNGTGIGVQGVSGLNIGTVGQSVSSSGVFGNSVSGSGVRGDTAAMNASVAGVYGTSSGAGGVGVRGDGTTGIYGVSTVPGGFGVTGESTATNGYGVYAKNINGIALGVEGNAVQNRDKGGLVKALLFVDPFVVSSQYIQRCFNGVFNLSNPNPGNPSCNLQVIRNDVGYYGINLGFRANDRFFSVTTNDHGKYRGLSCNAYTTDQPGLENFVYLDCHNGPTVSDRVDVSFYLTVY